MTDKLTWVEIKSRYPDEWVILVDLDADDLSNEVHAGVVFAHSKNERELLAATKDALSGQSSAVLFTGEIAESVYIC